MSCGGLKIQEPRNADLRRTFTPNSGFDFSTFTARMQVRLSEGAGGPPLLDIAMSATPNGSVFTTSGTAIVLTITKEDLETLPVAIPISDPIAFVYDIIITDQTGFDNYLTGGPFIMLEGVTR